jgi:hypothetical protein
VSKKCLNFVFFGGVSCVELAASSVLQKAKRKSEVKTLYRTKSMLFVASACPIGCSVCTIPSGSSTPVCSQSSCSPGYFYTAGGFCSRESFYLDVSFAN